MIPGGIGGPEEYHFGRAELEIFLQIEAEEDAVVGVQILVHAVADVVAAVVNRIVKAVVLATGDRTAGTVGIGVILSRFQRDRVDAIGGNDVAWEGVAAAGSVDDAAGRGIVNGDQLRIAVDQIDGFTEVPGAFQRRGQAVNTIERRLVAASFKGGKEEALVLAVVNLRDHYRSAERVAVVVASYDGDGNAEAVIGEGIGVEGVVLVVEISAAVIVVGPGLGDDVDDAATAATEFG